VQEVKLRVLLPYHALQKVKLRVLLPFHALQEVRLGKHKTHYHLIKGEKF
jgi:hypothetical protein